MVVTYLHLYYHVLWNPGYLPIGDHKLQDDQSDENEKKTKKSHRRRHRKSARKAESEKTTQSDTDVERGLGPTSGGVKSEPDLDLESFYTKDVFVCQQDGRPLWCSTCCQYKTDRAHHCRELGRCVRKMDHFCPWYDIKILVRSLRIR